MPTVGALRIETPSDRELKFTREFDAPRHLVYRAHTEPELLKKWCFGPDGWELAVCEVDLRVGGAFRYLWRKGDTDMGMGGTFREITPPARLVHTELFEQDWTGGETVVTTEFTERGGKTTLTCTVLYPSREARDGAAATPMAEGMEASYARIEAVVAGLR